MEMSRFQRIDDTTWRMPPQGAMRVPGILYADEDLFREMDDEVARQMANVATLPGIVQASYAMPDAHRGYGFPIGGVAAFDPDEGGVVSGGGVGFDISCGVRDLTTGLTADALEGHERELAHALWQTVPAGVGSTGRIHLDDAQMTAMLEGGAAWAVEQGWGVPADLERTEERGRMAGADPGQVSAKARKRQADEMGTLGSGNHYCEVQVVADVYDDEVARAWGLAEGDVLVSIHCGSRGMGHQIGTEFLREMVTQSERHGIDLPERELACAPLRSDLGRRYLGAMRAGINCALANRQIVTHLVREVFAEVLPAADLRMVYDVSHNTCKEERHVVDGRERSLFVHRKGATRAWGPGHPDLPDAFADTGQPVLIGGSMGTESWILTGMASGERQSFSSACHGAGRRMSRRAARKRWHGKSIVQELEAKGMLIRGHGYRGVAEEAPGAYKEAAAVIQAAEDAGLARKVARTVPVITVKG